jgi:hypothetical protein
MFGVALLGAVLAVIGAFLPWMQVGALLVNRGIDNPDGAIALGIGIAACAGALFGLLRTMNLWGTQSQPERPFRLRGLLGVGLVVAAVALFVTGFVDLRDIQGRISEMGSSVFGDVASVGSGVYMLLAGAVILGIGGLCCLFGRKRTC